MWWSCLFPLLHTSEAGLVRGPLEWNSYDTLTTFRKKLNPWWWRICEDTPQVIHFQHSTKFMAQQMRACRGPGTMSNCGCVKACMYYCVCTCLNCIILCICNTAAVNRRNWVCVDFAQKRWEFCRAGTQRPGLIIGVLSKGLSCSQTEGDRVQPDLFTWSTFI